MVFLICLPVTNTNSNSFTLFVRRLMSTKQLTSSAFVCLYTNSQFPGGFKATSGPIKYCLCRLTMAHCRFCEVLTGTAETFKEVWKTKQLENHNNARDIYGQSQKCKYKKNVPSLRRGNMDRRQKTKVACTWKQI